MKKFRYIPLVMAALILATYAMADIIGSLPYNLTNGTTADATQVMANYQKIIDDTNANGAHNGANSDITALLGLTTPIGPTSGGTNLWYGGTSTGSANAQAVATLVPNSYTLTSGYSATFVAGFTNTGATTLALNGTTAKNIFKRTPAGISALTGGEIVAATMTMVRYDGTQYQLISDVQVPFGPLTDITSVGGAPDLGTAGSHNVNITGTTTVTAFGSSANTTFPIYNVVFASALTLTHNGTSLIIPGAANILTETGGNARVLYLGSGNWRVLDYTHGSIRPQTGQLSRVNVYTANDTWTKAANENSVLFICTGGGGAGGGTSNTAAGELSAGAGGGAGGWAQIYKTAPAATYTLTVGAGGTGVSDATGNTGGNTTVGAILTCNGGVGGARIANTAGTTTAVGGAGGTASSGDLNIVGRAGGYSWTNAAVLASAGAGASNPLGQGAVAPVTASVNNIVGAAGGTCGGGGAGSVAAFAPGTTNVGGDGGVGCVIAYSYY